MGGEWTRFDSEESSKTEVLFRLDGETKTYDEMKEMIDQQLEEAEETDLAPSHYYYNLRVRWGSGMLMLASSSRWRAAWWKRTTGRARCWRSRGG